MTQRRSALGGWFATKSITNAFSAGGNQNSIQTSIGKTLATPALTANVLTNILTLNGRYEMGVCELASADVTSRTLRLQVVVDGVTVFDATSSAITTQNNGIGAAGPNTASQSYIGQPIRCNSSIAINVASSLTETAKATLVYTANQS